MLISCTQMNSRFNEVKKANIHQGQLLREHNSLQEESAMDHNHDTTVLRIDEAYYNSLDIQSFALMLKDPSYCYKFYWLEAIFQKE